MTFEELNKLIVAIRADKINYDFFARTVEMIIRPEYGVKDAVKGKTFKLNFENCIYFGGINSDKLSTENGIEFISWGELKGQIGADNLLNKMYTITGSNHVSVYSSSLNIQDYYFENVAGDVIRILSTQVTVTEEV